MGNIINLMPLFTPQDNILINSDGEAVISDFGLAHLVSEVPASETVRGAVRWMAPEVLSLKRLGICEKAAYNCPQDVWAFSMMALVILCIHSFPVLNH